MYFGCIKYRVAIILATECFKTQNMNGKKKKVTIHFKFKFCKFITPRVKHLILQYASDRLCKMDFFGLILCLTSFNFGAAARGCRWKCKMCHFTHCRRLINGPQQTIILALRKLYSTTMSYRPRQDQTGKKEMLGINVDSLAFEGRVLTKQLFDVLIEENGEYEDCRDLVAVGKSIKQLTFASIFSLRFLK